MLQIFRLYSNNGSSDVHRETRRPQWALNNQDFDLTYSVAKIICNADVGQPCNLAFTSTAIHLFESHPGVFTPLVWSIWTGEKAATAPGCGPRQPVRDHLEEVIFPSPVWLQRESSYGEAWEQCHPNTGSEKLCGFFLRACDSGLCVTVTVVTWKLLLKQSRLLWQDGGIVFIVSEFIGKCLLGLKNISNELADCCRNKLRAISQRWCRKIRTCWCCITEHKTWFTSFNVMWKPTGPNK